MAIYRQHVARRNNSRCYVPVHASADCKARHPALVVNWPAYRIVRRGI